MALQLLLLFVLLINSTGSSAEDTVFVLTGASVQMDIQTQNLPAEFDDLSWMNEKTDIIVKYTSVNVKTHPSYTNRTGFNSRTFSLTLKNMQKTDSGLYTAKTRGFSETVIAEHRVSVIDAVVAPVLTINSNWSRAELCNFTCQAGNITLISIIYNGSSCSEEVTSSDSYTLSVSCTGDTITCNHSNPVSWKSDTEPVEFCTGNKEKTTSALKSVPLHWLIPLIAIIPLSLCVTVTCFCFYKKNKEAKKTETYTEGEKQTSEAEMMAGSTNVHTVYDTADNQPDVTMRTSQTTATPDSSNQVEPPASERSKPTTIYCTIQKTPRPPDDNTIYAMVNKPSACESVQ